MTRAGSHWPATRNDAANRSGFDVHSIRYHAAAGLARRVKLAQIYAVLRDKLLDEVDGRIEHVRRFGAVVDNGLLILRSRDKAGTGRLIGRSCPCRRTIALFEGRHLSPRHRAWTASEDRAWWRHPRGYLAVAKVEQVIPDPKAPGMCLALTEKSSYLDFINPVPFSGPDGVIERCVLNEEGRISGRAQAAVRPISAADFNRIVSTMPFPLVAEWATPKAGPCSSQTIG